MGKKIGIMGGTFNPIHYGHLLLAESAREIFGLHKVLFMPSGNSYMKESQTIAKAGHRIQMTKLALEGNPFFELSQMETEREGPTYTCETLAELKRQNPEDQYFFLLGADNLFLLEKWKRADYLLQNCVIIAAARGTQTGGKTQEKAQYLRQAYQADIRMLPQRQIDISSSEIRRRLAESKSVRYLLPETVIHYIEENHLYKTHTQSEGGTEKGGVGFEKL